MNTYKRHRFPPDIISQAIWLHYRFNLSHRDIEDLLAERGITVLSTTSISGSVRFQSGAQQLLDSASLYLIGHSELTCQNPADISSYCVGPSLSW